MEDRFDRIGRSCHLLRCRSGSDSWSDTEWHQRLGDDRRGMHKKSQIMYK